MSNSVIHGDCLEVMKNIPDGSIDMILCDLPYGTTQNQKDVVTFKSKTVFPDVSNAKPSDTQSALITQRLAQVMKQYGLEYTPERDIREPL